MKNDLNEEKNVNKISKHIKILIGSNNKAKIEGAKLAFEKYFSDFELKELNLKYFDFYISSEAGLISIGDLFVNINMGVIEDINGYESIGTSQGFMVPKSRIEEIKSKSLGVIMDEIFHGINLSKNKGGIHFLSLGEVNRIQLVKDSFILALIPFLEQNKNIWR